MKLPQYIFYQAAGYNQTVMRYGMLNIEVSCYEEKERKVEITVPSHLIIIITKCYINF